MLDDPDFSLQEQRRRVHVAPPPSLSGLHPGPAQGISEIRACLGAPICNVTIGRQSDSRQNQILLRALYRLVTALVTPPTLVQKVGVRFPGPPSVED